MTFSKVIRFCRRIKIMTPISEVSPSKGAAVYSIDAATRDDVSWMARLESDLYSPSDAIPERILSDWYDISPGSFSVIKRAGERIGHIDILPVRSQVLRELLDGTMVEREVQGADLYPPQEKSSIRELYVESLAVLPPLDLSPAPAVSFILANFIQLVARLCEPRTVDNVYAIAASSAGERLMKRLSFVRRTSAAARLDRHDLWRAKLSDIYEITSAYSNARSRNPIL
jgi:hypothetical protein